MSPLLGRFLSVDSVQPNAPGTQGYNPYAYVANNPTTWVDPSGQELIKQIEWMGWQYAAMITAWVVFVDPHWLPEHIAMSVGYELATMTRHPPDFLTAFMIAAELDGYFCLVTVPVIVCALSPDCMERAKDIAEHYKAHGSDSPEGVTHWTEGGLSDAENNYP